MGSSSWFFRVGVVVSLVAASWLLACGSGERHVGGNAGGVGGAAGTFGASGHESTARVKSEGGGSGSESDERRRTQGAAGHSGNDAEPGEGGSASGVGGKEQSPTRGAAGSVASTGGTGPAGSAGADAVAPATVKLEGAGTVSAGPVDGVMLEVGLRTTAEVEALVGELPANVELAGAVTVSAPSDESMEFSSPIAVEFPNVIGAGEADQLLLGEVVDLDGRAPSEVVYRGTARIGSIVFDASGTGTFVVLRAANPLAIVPGILLTADRSPIHGGVVASTLSNPFVALSASDGRFYLPAGPAGARPTIFGGPLATPQQLPRADTPVGWDRIDIPWILPQPIPILDNLPIELIVDDTLSAIENEDEDDEEDEECQCDPVTFGNVLLSSTEQTPSSGNFYFEPGQDVHVFATNGEETWGLDIPESVEFVLELAKEAWKFLFEQDDSCEELDSGVSFTSSEASVADFPRRDLGELSIFTEGTAPIAANIRESDFKVCDNGTFITVSGAIVVPGRIFAECQADAPAWNSDTDACEPCPDAQSWNADADACECPAEQPVWNPDTEGCEACTEDAPVWNPDSEACEACPDDAPVWHAGTEACEPCPEVLPLWDPAIEACTCPDDRPVWNPDTEACEACPEVLPVWDADRDTCTCPADRPVWNFDTDACEACPEGHTWNPNAIPPACEEPGDTSSGGWGDPHLYTWDGHLYDFQRVGEFLLVSDNAELVVQARLRPYAGSLRVSAITSVAANVNGDLVQIDAGGSTEPVLWVNGSSSSPGELPLGGVVSAPGYDGGQRTILVEWADGTSLEAKDSGTHLDVRMTAHAGSAVRGLLGDSNGVPSDDLASRDGTPLTDPQDPVLARAFADSWRISPEESLFSYAPGEDTGTYTDLEFPYAPGTTASLTYEQYTAAKLVCLEAGITDEGLLEACIVDVGITDNAEFAAAAAVIPPPASVGPSVYELVSASDEVIADLVSEENPVPDGSVDRVFYVSVRGPLQALVLVTADRYGKTTETQLWDTLAAGQSIPSTVGSSHADGTSTWVLGVEENGALLNQSDGTLPALSAGVHTLRLTVADSGSLPEGQRFRLFGVTPGGSSVAGPVTDGSDPESGGPGGQGGSGSGVPPDDPCPGPDGYCWQTYADASSSSAWVEPASDTVAHARATAAPYESAGLGFAFDEEASAHELSGYDELVFDGVVALGQSFEVILSNDDAWCKWVLTGAGAARYTVDLSSPSQCGPTSCGYDLKANWVLFAAPWGGDAGSSAEIVVSHVEFVTTGSGAGEARAGDGALGPGGRCWSTFVYSAVGTADWVELDASTAHVHTVADGSDMQAGMNVELASEERDLSPYRWLEFDANIGDAEFFEFLAVGDGSWCWWRLQPAGATTYTVDLTNPSGCGGEDPATFRTLTAVDTLSFKNNGQPELDLAVTDIRFVQGAVVHDGGYVTSGPWQGHAWAEADQLGTTLSPRSFSALVQGDPLCITGTVVPDPDWQSWSWLGVNLNQATEGGSGSELTWSTEGFSGIRYSTTNPGGSMLRLWILGAAWYPEEAWCADIGTAAAASGQFEWSDFNTECWVGGNGTTYPANIPLVSVAVEVPPSDTEEVPYDFCLTDIQPSKGFGVTEI